jgi:hypothetical protein
VSTIRSASTARFSSAALLGVALVAATAGAARARSDADPRTKAAPRVVTITARDYAFESPDTVAAGVTALRLLNRGTELHHIALFRLDGGHTMADFYAALKAGGPPPSWVYAVGGPNSPVPGGESVAALDLKPGHYAVTCFIPSKDGMPHVMKGMSKELVVAAPTRAAVTPVRVAAPANTITLSDYHFAIAHPITAGTHTIRIANAAEQSHEIFVVKLVPGKTAHEMAEWAEHADGPPPGEPLGGTTGMAKGEWNDVTIAFTPGEYALLCFWPDAKDGKPHVAHGMLSQFTIR